MDLDFRGCKTKKDVEKVFNEKENELKKLKSIMFPITEGEKSRKLNLKDSVKVDLLTELITTTTSQSGIIEVGDLITAREEVIRQAERRARG